MSLMSRWAYIGRLSKKTKDFKKRGKKADGKFYVPWFLPQLRLDFVFIFFAGFSVYLCVVGFYLCLFVC